MRFLDAAGSGIREFPRKNDNLDASGRGWTAPNVIRNQQVSGSSPLAGSNRINNLQRFCGIGNCGYIGTMWANRPLKPARASTARQHRERPGPTPPSSRLAGVASLSTASGRRLAGHDPTHGPSLHQIVAYLAGSLADPGWAAQAAAGNSFDWCVQGGLRLAKPQRRRAWATAHRTHRTSTGPVHHPRRSASSDVSFTSAARRRD